MSGTGGLSIANNLLANTASLNESLAHDKLKTTVQRLSSGLRINTAADDPSGLAIAETLQGQISGYDSAVRSVQDARNAATVAEGAMQTQTDILQRIRAMAVQASSDLTSSNDKQMLQTEVDQLLREFNHISETTRFNDVPLLDGSHAGYQSGELATIKIESNTTTVASPTLLDGDFSSPFLPNNNSYQYAPPGTPWAFSGGAGVIRGPGTPGGFAPPIPSAVNQISWLNNNGDFISQNVTLEAGVQYQLSFQAGEDLGAGANGLTVQLDGTTIYTCSPPPNQQWQDFTTPAFTTTSGTHTITFANTNGAFASMYLQHISLQQVTPPPDPTAGLLVSTVYAGNGNLNTTAGGVFGFGGTGTVDGTIQLQVINTGASIAVQETFFNSATGATCVSPYLIPPNGFADAFDNVTAKLGNFTADNVGEGSYIKVFQFVAPSSNPQNPALMIHSAFEEGSVLQMALPEVDTQMLRISNINLLLSTASSASLGAEDAIGQVDHALDKLLATRATVGALMVRLEQTMNDDNIASVNLTASKGAIWDFNMGQGATELAKDEILAQVGQQMIASSNTNAQTVEQLFRNPGT